MQRRIHKTRATSNGIPFVICWDALTAGWPHVVALRFDWVISSAASIVISQSSASIMIEL